MIFTEDLATFFNDVFISSEFSLRCSSDFLNTCFIDFLHHLFSKIFRIRISDLLILFLFLDFLKAPHIFIPFIDIKNPYQEVPLIFNISVLNSPYHFIQEPLQITFDLLQSPSFLTHFHEDQFKLFDLCPHIFKPRHLISACSLTLALFLGISSESLVIIEFIKPFPANLMVVWCTKS